MEVGAVKQAFNNEVILLKKKLNQAKTQVIHKLTRKAKTLTSKKTPEHLKEKVKKKAESAINEVLIIKKIKARDIAKFIITHTGKVSDYINRPKVDSDKACARLVLHKSLQDKYTFFRSRFGNIPIKDLFMSRQERRKLKKEAREQQKNKKKGKEGKVTKSAGVWDVEDLGKGDDKDVSQNEIGSDNEMSDDESEPSQDELATRTAVETDSEQGGSEIGEEINSNLRIEERSDDEPMESESDGSDVEVDNDESEDEVVEEMMKLKPEIKVKSVQKPISTKTEHITDAPVAFMARKPIKVHENKDRKINKNKNLQEKLVNRNFKKDDDDGHIEGRKVVDPFFITATGENYLSLAEPRQPDEVKEVHKQGNRQERRAAMFGRKFKPRNDIRQNNFRSNNYDEGHDRRNSSGINKNDKFSNGEDFNNRNHKFHDANSKFSDRNGKFNDTRNNFSDRNDRFNSKNINNNRNDDKKEEKLHPSWEAKRKLKTMSLLPSQGKKIVFDDN